MRGDVFLLFRKLPTHSVLHFMTIGTLCGGFRPVEQVWTLIVKVNLGAQVP